MSRTKNTVKRVVRRVPPVNRFLQERLNLRKAVSNLESEKHELINDTRRLLSYKYIRGSGIEIGALHMPLPLPPHAKIKYVDYIPVHKLREQYPELKELPLVKVGIVDNGERLTKVKNSSVDFIIANHFLEHCQDPIGTILNFYKKLRPGGILYMAIPDKRYTFDMYRPLTGYKHLIEEYKLYPSKKFYVPHTREIVKLTEGVEDKAAIESRVKDLVDMKYSIHHHVWTQKELVEFFYETSKRFSLDLEIQALINNQHEAVFIIQKLNPKEENKRIKSIEKHYFSGNKIRKSK
jgi:predicted SAM-dependent methyltransferase